MLMIGYSILFVNRARPIFGALFIFAYKLGSRGKVQKRLNHALFSIFHV